MNTIEQILNSYNHRMSGVDKNLWKCMIKNKQATIDQFKTLIEKKIEEKSNPNNPSTKPMRVKKPCNCGKGKKKDWSSWDK